jgi:hypothetical protein
MVISTETAEGYFQSFLSGLFSGRLNADLTDRLHEFKAIRRAQQITWATGEGSLGFLVWNLGRHGWT